MRLWHKVLKERQTGTPWRRLIEESLAYHLIDETDVFLKLNLGSSIVHPFKEIRIQEKGHFF